MWSRKRADCSPGLFRLQSVTHNVQNHVIDSVSIEVNRRQRRAKTDRLDVRKLLTMLLRHMAGERKVWSVVRVPSVEEEDRRQLHRELTTATQDRTRVINRIKGLLALCACNGLRTPHLHGVASGHPHPYWLQSRDGKVRPDGYRHLEIRVWTEGYPYPDGLAQSRGDNIDSGQRSYASPALR